MIGEKVNDHSILRWGLPLLIPQSSPWSTAFSWQGFVEVLSTHTEHNVLHSYPLNSSLRKMTGTVDNLSPTTLDHWVPNFVVHSIPLQCRLLGLIS